MQSIERLVTALPVLSAVPAILDAVWLRRDQPDWVLCIIGPAVRGLVGAVIG